MTAPSLREAVARAINKLHPPTCDGPGGCSCAYECERWDIGWVNHLEDADAALAVAREYYAAFVHAELDRLTLHISADEIAAAIRADQGPK